MKISFIVTYYNQEQYVKQSLDSILEIEKPCEWEIIVGDDGSSDGTVDIVKEYMAKYPGKIRLNIMPRDKTKKYDSVRRASANRLSALELATGDAFCTLDGDDFFCDRDFIKDAIKILQEENNVTVVAFGFRYFTDGSYGKEIILPVGYVDKRNYLRSFYLPAGACVHRLCWVKERLNYIKKIGYFDDNDIVINSLNFGEMYAFDRAIYAYRQTGVSVYTSMNTVEQAVLNVQGFDVDKRLIGQEYYDCLLDRNANSIMTMYIWRKVMKQVLGTEKYNLYFEACEKMPDSLAYKFFIYETSDIHMKDILEIRSYYKMYIKKLVKYFLHRLIMGCELNG